MRTWLNMRGMDQAMRLIVENPWVLILPVLLFTGTLLAGFLVRRLMFGVVRRWSAGTDSHLGAIVISTLRGPLMLWSLILALHVATQNSDLPDRWLRQTPKILETLWALSFTIAASRFAGSSVKFYGGRNGAHDVTSLTQKLAQVTVTLIGLAWMLKVVFELPLTPILTTLGVGGLAVALALQDTLSNLFAGFYVSVSGLVRLGDYIKLNSGEEGYVTDINWRCTTMRGLTHNTVVVPNSKLGQAIYTNYFLPDRRMTVSVSVSVGYDSDIDRVEQILLEEVTAAIGAVRGVLADPPPNIKFDPGLGDWAMVFKVNFSVGEFGDQYVAQSEMRKLIYKRLRKEGVSMPFPTQSIRLERTDG